MLLGHANFFSDVHLCIEPLVPLWVVQPVLSECLKTKLLVVHCCERVLVLRLDQDSISNQPVECQRVIGSADHFPFCVLLHFILLQLCALFKNQREPFPSMLYQLITSLSVCASLIVGMGLLQVTHKNGNVHIRFVFTLHNRVLQYC